MQTPNSCEIQYSLTYQDVVEVLRIARESQSCASLDLAIGDMKLSLTRAGSADVSAPAAVASTMIAVAPVTAVPAAAPTTPPAPALAAADANYKEVKAPMLGIFYRSPSPGAPAFVNEGDTVKADDTIGLIEAMKLFAPVTAGVAGRIVQIVAEDAVLVEHGQPLMLVEPSQG